MQGDLEEKIISQRKCFIEMHNTVGAYLLFKQNFQAIHELWYSTPSQPPEYVLFPHRMNDIFNLFFNLSGPIYYSNCPNRYSFKGLEFEGMNGSQDVLHYIKLYSGLLFLRLWTIGSSGYGNNPLEYPIIPVNQEEKKKWIRHLPFFSDMIKRQLEENLNNDFPSLKIITEENCKNINKPYPIDFLKELDKRLQSSFRETLLNDPLDDAKINDLKTYAVSSLKELFKSYNRIAGDEVQKKNRDKISEKMEVFRGLRMIFDRESFIENTSVSFIDFDKVLPNQIKTSIIHHISSKFVTNRTKSYEVPFGKSFMAIDALQINPEEHAIISFSKDIEYYRNFQNVDIQIGTGDIDFIYNEVPIYCFDVRGVPIVFNKTYILKRADFPMFLIQDWKAIKDLPKQTIDYWNDMEVLDDDSNLYYKIKEIQQHTELIKDYADKEEKEQIERSIEINIDFIGYFWFKKNVKIVEIDEGNRFQENLDKDLLGKIEPF